MSSFLAVAILLSGALAEVPRVPSRQIPPSVLVELQLLENRFELALATDCDAERCFSKGCAYVDHAVADQPRSSSMPGLGQEPGPGSVASQEYLTQARCSFAHEKALESADVQALVRRLQAKLSSGWTVVTVSNEVLQPLPPYLREPPEPEPEDPPEPVQEAPVIEPEPWTAEVAGRELWSALLPHFFWMIGVGLVTLAGLLAIWAWRRVGVTSLEEQALLAQLSQPPVEPPATPDGSDTAAAGEASEVDRAYVAQQQEIWEARLQGLDPLHPDPELSALIRGLLRSGDIPLLAKAVLKFPDSFPAAFPLGGDIASAKLELAAYLETVDVDTLPSDVAFFESLNRHALSAALVSQSDASVVRSLHEDFGASGLVDLIGRLSPRVGALLFALAPLEEQHEVARLLTPRRVWDLAEQLLRSNRMDPAEAEHLFAVLGAAGGGAPAPAVVEAVEVSDRGAAFDAAGALCALLSRLEPEHRAALFAGALKRFQGALPAWYRDILVADMLLVLPAEARADLLLGVDPEILAAWLSLEGPDTTASLLAGVPDSLRVSVEGWSRFPSRARQLALAARGRRELARGFQRQLARARIPFEGVVVSQDPGEA
jgi:hypothetical protein